MRIFPLTRLVLNLAGLITLYSSGNVFADVEVSGGVSLYGVLDQGVQSQSLLNPYTNVSSIYQGLYASSGTSRFGFKASREIGEGIKGVAQAEIELAPDSATLLPSSNRQAFVGFEKSNVGSVLLGTMETTAYEVWGMDANGRVEYKPQVWRTLTSVALQDRANNSIKYISPTYSGFTAHVMKSFAEKSSTASVSAPTAGSANSFSEFTSIGLKYKDEKISAAWVHDQTSYIVQAYRFAGITNAGVSASNIPTYDGVTAYNTTLVYGSSNVLSGYTEPTQRNIFAVNYKFNDILLNYIFGKSYQKAGGSNSTHTIGMRKTFDKLSLALSYGNGTISSPATVSSTSYKYASNGKTSDTTMGAYYFFDKSTHTYLIFSNSRSSVAFYDGRSKTVALGARYNF